MNVKSILHRRQPGLAVAGLGAILLLVTGCSAFDDLAHGRSESAYTNKQMFEQETRDQTTWMPADAAHIVLVTSTRAPGTETISFRSAQPLADCETTERRSAPTMPIADAIDVYGVEEVALCGDWAVAEEDGAFLAWTPAVEAD